MLGWVRRLLAGGEPDEDPEPAPDEQPQSEPARRLDAAHRRLKQTIAPPEDPAPE